MALVSLRPVERRDLNSFFEHLQDPVAVWMAAFTPADPSDREAFDAHWNRLLTDDTIITRTIEDDAHHIVGHIASFDMLGDREVTYWVDRAAWGRGIATGALRQFLDIDNTRPLHGRASADNAGSIRAMEKCGFVIVEQTSGFATARNEEVDEIVLRVG